MKKFLNKCAEFFGKNIDVIIINSIMLGIFWAFGMTLFTEEGARGFSWFICRFFTILPIALLFGFLWIISFIPYMQKITGEYIIPYIHARFFRITLHKYEESIEYYKTALNMLKTSKPTRHKKKMKKSYLFGTYNDLAICYSKLGNKEFAEKYIKKAARYLDQKKKQKYLDKMYKKYIIEKSKMSNKKKYTIITFSFIILIILANVLSDYKNNSENNKFVEIATTDSIKKADEIQDLLTNVSYIPTLRDIDGTKTIISSKVKCHPECAKIQSTILIADSPIFDSNIGFSNRLFGISKEHSERKEINEILKSIPGVIDIDTNINIPESRYFTYKNDDEKTKATIIVSTSEDFDKKRIERTVKNILLGSVTGLTEENINIAFHNIEKPNQKIIKRHKRKLEGLIYDYYNRARTEYIKNEPEQNYANAIYYVDLAKDRYLQSGFSTTPIKRIIELDKQINKSPNNYKLYIERGNVRNIPFLANLIEEEQSVTSNYNYAIADYEKALELNPKAFEVYEKLGDAHLRNEYDKYFGGCPNCRVKEAKLEYDKTIDYYNKSIKLLGDNDRIYAKFGDVYWLKKDYQKALEYYNQVKAPFNISKTIVPNRCINKYRIHTVLFRMADCYDNLKDRKKAIECVEQILQNSDNENEIKSAKNYRFNLYLKSWNLLEAIKHIKDNSWF